MSKLLSCPSHYDYRFALCGTTCLDFHDVIDMVGVRVGKGVSSIVIPSVTHVESVGNLERMWFSFLFDLICICRTNVGMDMVPIPQ